MKLLLLFALLGSLSFATMINGVAAVINNEAITLYDISQATKKYNISSKNALSKLIRTALENDEAKKRGISVSSFDVNNELKRIAAQNRVSVPTLLNALSAQGQSEREYKDQIKQAIQQQKLYQKIAYAKLERPSALDIQEFYNMNKSRFVKPEKVNVIGYYAKSKVALRQTIATPLLNVPGVSTKFLSLEPEKMAPVLADLIISTKTHEFTPVIPNQQGGFVTFLVQEKVGLKAKTIEEAKDQITNLIIEGKREQVLNDYFLRLRANADIKLLRTSNQ
jgi:hypothetical protein